MKNVVVNVASWLGIACIVVVVIVGFYLPGVMREERTASQPQKAGPPVTLTPTREAVDRDEAIRTAQEAVTRLAKPYDSAEVPQATLQDDVRGRQVWRVLFGREEDYEIRVDPTSAEVVFFLERRSFRPIAADQPEDRAILSNERTLAFALQHLANFGFTPEPGQKPRISASQTGDSTDYLVTFPRLLNGYEYDDDWVLIDIDAQGRLLGYHKAHTSSTCSTTIRLTEDQALGAALSILKDKTGEPDPNRIQIDLKIVQPNYYWSGRPVLGRVTTSRLAYVIRATGTTKAPEEIIVWVDAENGNVLGGTRSR